MNKRYHLFNYAITWIGIIRLLLCIGCIVAAVFFLKSDEPFALRIGGILIMLFAVFVVSFDIISNIKEGINKAKNHSQDYLYGREKRNNNVR